MNMDNLDAQTEQMIRQYAEENINILFDDLNIPPQTGGRKRSASKKRKTNKRKTNKRRNSKKMNKRRKTRRY